MGCGSSVVDVVTYSPIYDVMGGYDDDKYDYSASSIQGSYPASATNEEIAIQREVLKLMQEAQIPTEQEQLMSDLALKTLQAQVANLPMEQEYREMSMGLLQEQITYSRDQLAKLSEAKELGEITGDLTEDELAKLDQLQANAISSLTEVVGEQAQEVVKSEIASLVERGVLQGNIGAMAIAKVGETATKEIARGTRDIESLRITSQLGMEEAKKQFGLQYQDLVQRGILTREQAMLGMSQNINAQRMAELQATTQNVQFQSQLAQQWDQSKLAAGMQQWGMSTASQSSAADRALQAAIAQSQLGVQYAGIGATEKAGQWGALGTVAGMGGAALLA